MDRRKDNIRVPKRHDGNNPKRQPIRTAAPPGAYRPSAPAELNVPIRKSGSSGGGGAGKSNANKTASFVKGAAILGVAMLIGKVIGALYRIPLNNILGTAGMAYYQSAYPVYAFLVVVSTAGFPTAISKVVSERAAMKDYKGAHKVFKTASKLLLIFGIVTSVLMAAISPLLAAASYPEAQMSFLALAPALFFVSVISAYRGYFQGLQMMAPSAISQVVEQIVKLSGLVFAGVLVGSTLEGAAAGALLGVSISEAVAMVVLILLYRKHKNIIYSRIAVSEETKTKSSRSIAKQLLKIAVPITIGASIMPLVQEIDTIIIPNALKTIEGLESQVRELHGLLTGNVNTLIAMPSVLAIALSASLVPAVSTARANRNATRVRLIAGTGMKISILLGLPCAVGLAVLAEPILKLLYTSLTPEEVGIGAQLMLIGAPGVLFLFLVQTVAGVLQGTGKVMIPVYNIIAGAVVKIVLSLALVGNPDYNIMGAAIGTVACYAIAAILNFTYAVRKLGLSLSVADNFIKPLAASAMMGAAAYFSYGLLSSRFGNGLSALAAIVVAIVFYVLLILLFGVLKKQDMEFMPGGRKLARLMVKLGAWKEG